MEPATNISQLECFINNTKIVLDILRKRAEENNPIKVLRGICNCGTHNLLTYRGIQLGRNEKTAFILYDCSSCESTISDYTILKNTYTSIKNGVIKYD